MRDLAALEAVEREAWRSIFEACPAELQGELGLTHRTIGDALVLCASGVPHPLFNRVIGLGTVARPTRAQVEDVIGTYEAAGVSRYMVHLWPEVADRVSSWLGEHGVGRAPRAWVKLAAAEPPRVDEVRCSLPVRRARTSESGRVGALLTRAFDLPEGVAAVFGALTAHPDWHVFVCTDGDALVGAGLLFAGEEAAYLAAAGTDAGYRGRGVQHALIVARLRAAQALGYRRFSSETGERVAGDPQHSQHNLERVGLRPVGVRDNYSPSSVRPSRGPDPDAT